MANNNDVNVSGLKNEDEDDRSHLPTFQAPNFKGEGSFLFYKGAWLPKVIFKRKNIFRDIEAFQFKNDILVASFPKSGTTWVQEIVSQIESLHMKNGTEWKSINIEDRFPFLEFFYPGINEIAKMKPPRLIKTHLPYQLLPPSIANGVKIIYVARDPRDVSVSFYHFVKMLKSFSYVGTFDNFFDIFISGKGHFNNRIFSVLVVLNLVMVPGRSTSYRIGRDEHLYFLTYESIHQEPHKVIKEISHFIGKPVTDDQMEKIVEATKFDKMKDDSSTNYKWWETTGQTNINEASFFRKGIVGDWTNYFDESKLKKIEDLFDAYPALKKIFKK